MYNVIIRKSDTEETTIQRKFSLAIFNEEKLE